MAVSPTGGQTAQQIDLTSLIAAFQALTQTIGSNGRTLLNILNNLTPVGHYHIAGAGTFAVQTEPGALLSLNINSGPIGGTGTLYDSASVGSLTDMIGVLNFGTVAPAQLPLGPGERGLALNNGLVVVTTGTADITLGVVT